MKFSRCIFILFKYYHTGVFDHALGNHILYTHKKSYGILTTPFVCLVPRFVNGFSFITGRNLTQKGPNCFFSPRKTIQNNNQGPVGQSIVSLATSLRCQLVCGLHSQICYYFFNNFLCVCLFVWVEALRPSQHFFPVMSGRNNKNNSIFVIFSFTILTKRGEFRTTGTSFSSCDYLLWRGVIMQPYRNNIGNVTYYILLSLCVLGERGGLVVEPRTPEREVGV